MTTSSSSSSSSSKNNDNKTPTGRSSTNKPTALGKHVGIIPLAGPSELTTRGLEWDVEGWRTEFGGRMSTSNHTTPGHDVVEVRTTADVLFTIDFAPASAVSGLGP